MPFVSRAQRSTKRAARAGALQTNLNTVAAVGERCGMVYRWVADGRSPHFTLEESRLPTVAAYVAEVTRAAYPDLKIPYHSRWRHFATAPLDPSPQLASHIHA